MTKGKPDPNCTECYGEGKVTLFTSSSTCRCVNHKSSLAGATKKETNPEIILRIRELQLSAHYIAYGISTWFAWSGIEGHICPGCGAEMNVIGTSYTHWCPLCDPGGKKRVLNCPDHNRTPFDFPAFGPSVDTIREGVRLADSLKQRQRAKRLQSV